MKKLSIVAVAALFAISLSSCKKDYKCTCTTTGAGLTSTSTTVDIGKQKKKDADKACTARVTSVPGYTMTCSVD